MLSWFLELKSLRPHCIISIITWTCIRQITLRMINRAPQVATTLIRCRDCNSRMQLGVVVAIIIWIAVRWWMARIRPKITQWHAKITSLWLSLNSLIVTKTRPTWMPLKTRVCLSWAKPTGTHKAVSNHITHKMRHMTRIDQHQRLNDKRKRKRACHSCWDNRR